MEMPFVTSTGDVPVLAAVDVSQSSKVEFFSDAN